MNYRLRSYILYYIDYAEDYTFCKILAFKYVIKDQLRITIYNNFNVDVSLNDMSYILKHHPAVFL